MNMNNVIILLKKQTKNVIYNAFIISSLIMMPFFAWIMTSGEELAEELAYALLFYVLLNTVINAINMAACLIAEEKEQNTLNVLMTSTVKASELLVSNLIITFLAVIVSNVAIYFLLSGYYFMNFSTFIFSSSLGSIVAILMGAIIGIVCKSQMIASSVAAALGFASLFITDILYHLNLSGFLNDVVYQLYPLPFVRLLMTSGMTYYEETAGFVVGDIIGLLINIVLFAGIFIVIYRKRGLEKSR